jgi:hypothetical protein
MRTFILVVAISLFSSIAPAAAQSFPDGPGKAILEKECSTCHAPDMVRTYRKSVEEWNEVIVNMIDLGSGVTEEQVPTLATYLATHFGRGDATAPSAAEPSAAAQHAAVTPAELVSSLPQSKLSLVDGIRQAETANGPAVSAKFEVEDGKLLLSVYTAKNGLSKDAEHNVLMELKGDATIAQWQPKLEVFEDKPHIARAAMHLTVLQFTKMTLSDLIQKAAAVQNGTVYSAIPTVKGQKAAVDFLIGTPDGKSIPLTLDAQTGQKL